MSISIRLRVVMLLCREKEAELMRQHGAHKDDLEKHAGLMTDAQRDAEAHRAQADKARAAAQGLPGYASE